MPQQIDAVRLESRLTRIEVGVETINEKLDSLAVDMAGVRELDKRVVACESTIKVHSEEHDRMTKKDRMWDAIGSVTAALAGIFIGKP